MKASLSARTSLLIAAILASAAFPSGAEVVYFRNGRCLEARSFQVVGDMARVEFHPDGVVLFPLDLVERVITSDTNLTPQQKPIPAVDPGSRVTNGKDRLPDMPNTDSIVETAAREEPRPALSIAGRVLDEAGEPVDGIELRARAITLSPAAEGHGGSRPEVQARSDPDGSYRFEQLAHGEYAIRTLATDRYTSAQTVVRTGVDFANLVVSEERLLSIYGSVTSVPNEPLEGVQVTCVGQSSGKVFTDWNGLYRLEIPVVAQDRVHTLKFELEGYRQRALSLPDSEIFGRSEVQLDASLERLASLAPVEGSVRDTEGLPVAGETVHLVGELRYQSVTDQDGAFSMPEVETGAVYRLWISPQGPYRQYRKQVRVAAEGLQADVVLESKPQEYGRLAGRMIDASGNPVPNFSLRLRSSNGSGRQPLAVTGDGEGRFTVEKVPLGRVSFSTVSNPQFTISGLELSSGQTEDVILTLDLGGYEFRGRVIDGDGNPVAAPRVTLQWWHQGSGLQSRSLRQTSADANGFFSFTEVGPGLHSVSVEAPGFQRAQLEAESARNLLVQLNQLEQSNGGN